MFFRTLLCSIVLFVSISCEYENDVVNKTFGDNVKVKRLSFNKINSLFVQNKINQLKDRKIQRNLSDTTFIDPVTAPKVMTYAQMNPLFTAAVSAVIDQNEILNIISAEVFDTPQGNITSTGEPCE